MILKSKVIKNSTGNFKVTITEDEHGVVGITFISYQTIIGKYIFSQETPKFDIVWVDKYKYSATTTRHQGYAIGAIRLILKLRKKGMDIPSILSYIDTMDKIKSYHIYKNNW